jgi:hypothetical protein
MAGSAPTSAPNATLGAKLMRLFDYRLTYVALVVVLFVAMAPLLPFDDDLLYITPATTPDIAGLLPTADFWRPFDYLFRMLLGLVPQAFPLLNHFAVVVGHVLNTCLLHAILKRRLGLEAHPRFLACLFFLVSPAVFVAVASIDSLNQVWSAFFGMLAVFLLLGSTRPTTFVASFACCVLALFWKEGGMPFFVIAPAVGIFAQWSRDSAAQRKVATTTPQAPPTKPPTLAPQAPNPRAYLKRLALYLLIGLAICAIYLAIRFFLLGQMSLGSAGGRYAMSLNPLNIAGNLAVLLASCFSSIDSIAILAQPRNLPLAAITALASLPFILWVLRETVRWLRTPRARTRLIFLVLMALTGVSPYLLMASAGEMHAYQLMPFVAVLIALYMGNRCATNGGTPAASVTVKPGSDASTTNTPADVHAQAHAQAHAPVAFAPTPTHPQTAAPSTAPVPTRKLITVVFALLFLGAAITDAHKWLCMKDAGDSTLPVYNAITAEYAPDEHPLHVKAFTIEDEGALGYSVFKLSAADAAEGGIVSGAYWNWRYPLSFSQTEIKQTMTLDQLIATHGQEFAAHDTVWVVWADGSAVVLKQGRDY